VGILAVIAQPLAVVGHGDDHGVVEPAEPLHPPEQLSQRMVDVGDLALVGIAGVAGREGFGRFVAGVGIEHVHPGQEGLRAVESLDPADSGGDHVLGRAFRVSEASRGGRSIEPVVVDLESLIQAELRVERVGADEGAGAESGVGEGLRQGVQARVQAEAAVVANSVEGRIGAGEDRGVGGQRDRGRGVGAVEQNTSGRQGVQRGRVGVLTAVTAQAIHAGGVERDQHHRGGTRGIATREQADRRQREHKPARHPARAAHQGLARGEGCQGRLQVSEPGAMLAREPGSGDPPPAEHRRFRSSALRVELR
jgi:hypothetical protein